MINTDLFTSPGPSRRFASDMHPFKPKIQRAKADAAPPRLMSFSKAYRAMRAKRGAGSESGGSRRSALQGGRGISGHGSKSRMQKQRAVVKARVVRNGQGGGRGKANNPRNPRAALNNHLSYLERDEVGESGERGQFFGEHGELNRATDVASFADKVAEDRHYFRLIISPEKGKDLDLQDYARDFMQQTERDLGTRLEWVGVAHYNTDNPHVHLLIRGKDELGADLVINRDYVSHGFRETAQDIATRYLGPRLESEIENERLSHITAERITPIDRHLRELANRDPEGVVSTRRPDRIEPDWAYQNRMTQIGRLQHLEGMGLAEEVDSGRWVLSENLEERLRDIGQRRDIIQQIHNRLSPRSRVNDVVVYNAEAPPGVEITGEVIDRGRVNEIDDQQYVVINAADSKAYYVKLSGYSEKLGPQVGIGSIVSVQTARRPRVGRADENAIAFAHNNNGIYDAGKHREQVIRAGKVSDPERYIESHILRMEANARRGLIEQIDTGQYRIPADLRQTLEALASKARNGSYIVVKQHGASGLREQMSATGPTWLDSKIARGDHLQPQRHIGASRFHKRVIAAMRGRIAELRKLGLIEDINGEIRLRNGALDALYEQEVALKATQLSRHYGQHIPLRDAQGFRGTVESVERLQSGNHAIVVDKSTQQFVVVPSSRGLERQLGKPVEVTLRAVKAPQLELPTQLQMRMHYVALEAPTRQITRTRSR